MYRRITIRNFRSIEDATVVLSPFTVVVGPNGSGKSNFVDAFVFMRSVATDAEAAIASRGGISSVTRWSKTKPFDVHLALKVASTREKLDTEYFAHDLTIQTLNEGAWKFKRETITLCLEGQAPQVLERKGKSLVAGGEVPEIPLNDTGSAMVFARQILKIPPAMRAGFFGVRRYRLNPDAMRQPQLATESARLDETGANVATALRKIRDSKELESVLIPMQHIVPGLRDIRPLEAGRHLLLQFEQEQGNGVATFTSSEISEGALRALGIIVAALQMAKNELLVIEEPEANIHAGAAGLVFDVLRVASSLGSILITTHSPEILDAARDEDIVVCRYDAGVTRLGQLDSGQRELVRKGLFKLAELMRAEPLRIEGDLPEAAKA